MNEQQDFIKRITELTEIALDQERVIFEEQLFSIFPEVETDEAKYKVIKDYLYEKKIGINAEDSYVNAGVLLIDLEKLRELDIREMMSNFVNEHSCDINYADQDILNGMFNGKFGVLKPVYNVMTLTCVYTYEQIRQIRHPSFYYSENDIVNAQKNPVIVHYTTCMNNIRPWCEGSHHPFAIDFDKYMFMSPWKYRKKSVAHFDKADQMIVKSILALPDFMSFRLIGLIHGFIRPMVLRLRKYL